MTNPTPPTITDAHANHIKLYGTVWCSDCKRSKKFLGEQRVHYDYVDIEEDEAGAAIVEKLNDGHKSVPTIVFPDGSFLVEPNNAELAIKLGLTTKAKLSYYDLIVVGGGPAGLTAALYAAREGMEVLVLERSAFGGQAGITERLENFPGFPDGISGAEFADRLKQQAERFGVELVQATQVATAYHEGESCYVRCKGGDEYGARALLIATGSNYKRLDVPGESTLIGAGVHFCATCDGPFYKGKSVAVIGGGNSAAEESLFLVKFVERVTLLVRGEALTASKIIQDKVLSHPQIDVRFNTEPVRFEGEGGKLKALEVRDRKTGATDRLQPAGVFIFIGLTPNTTFLEGSGVSLDRWGFVITGHDLSHGGHQAADHDVAALETSTHGIFAAGDVRAGSTKQVASAAGEGAAVAILIRDHLREV